jgi:hypothetical protein
MSLYQINARLISHYPIAFKVTAAAVATDIQIVFDSPRAMPILEGQVFSLSLGLIRTEVTVATNQVIMPGSNTLSVLPLATDLAIGAESMPRPGKNGNEVEQTIQCEFLASLTKVSQQYQDSPATGGVDSSAVKYIGRIMKPRFIPAYLENGRVSMQLQTGEDVYTEGQFLPEEASLSRLNLQKIFGDKITGWYVRDTPARYLSGKVFDGCC